jgi:O-acetyl-ADP-ribose deacetylase (regulator of RNase III)
MTMTLHLHLVDLDARVVDAWQQAFSRFPEVSVVHGDILAVAHHLVISPANSHGFMDGGVDRAYAQFFGQPLVRQVREAVLRRPEGFLPVGAALAIQTGHPRIQYLILAPTMVSPEHVPATHAYRALRAALRLARADPALHGDWFCPGLTTLVGGTKPDHAAAEMAEAYDDWMKDCLTWQ